MDFDNRIREILQFLTGICNLCGNVSHWTIYTIFAEKATVCKIGTFQGENSVDGTAWSLYLMNNRNCLKIIHCCRACNCNLNILSDGVLEIILSWSATDEFTQEKTALRSNCSDNSNENWRTSLCFFNWREKTNVPGEIVILKLLYSTFYKPPCRLNT